MAQSCVGQVLIPHYGETILENKVAKSDLGKWWETQPGRSISEHGSMSEVRCWKICWIVGHYLCNLFWLAWSKPAPCGFPTCSSGKCKICCWKVNYIISFGDVDAVTRWYSIGQPCQNDLKTLGRFVKYEIFTQIRHLESTQEFSKRRPCEDSLYGGRDDEDIAPWLCGWLRSPLIPPITWEDNQLAYHAVDGRNPAPVGR